MNNRVTSTFARNQSALRSRSPKCIHWLAATVVLTVFQQTAAAQFTTVINIPPDSVRRPIRSDTLLNVLDGGTLRSTYSSQFQAGGKNGSDSNISVNVDGGVVGSWFHANSGVEVNIYDGVVGARFQANPGSQVNITGGMIGEGFDARWGSQVTVSGGIVGRDFDAHFGSQVTLVGGEFQLNGFDLADSTASLSRGDVLSGTLKDGSPFIFSPLTGDDLSNVTLASAPLPAADLTPILVDSRNAPDGLRTGQTLTLEEGGVLGENFRAVNATLNINGGYLNDLTVVGSDVNFGAGEIGGDFQAFYGSRVIFCGGDSRYGFTAREGSQVTVVSGVLSPHLNADFGSQVTISGGTLDGNLRALSGSEVTLLGTEFLLDDQPIRELNNTGESLVLETRDWETLSGTLSDGSPFRFRQGPFKYWLGDIFAEDATLRLTLVPAHDCNADFVFDIADTLCATPETIGNILAAANLIQGDADGNGQVEFADFLTLSGNFGQNGNYQQGNFDVLGEIDFSDFLILSNNFRQTTEMVASVPEPTVPTLLAIGLMAFVTSRRRTRTN